MNEKPALRKRSPGHECGTLGTCYDVLDPLDSERVIGHVRMYAATNTSWGGRGASRHVDRGWVAALADGSEPKYSTLYDTRYEALNAILRAVYP